MFDDKYLTNSRMCCSALFNSPYSIIGLCLAHLRYYLPHSSTKWVLRLPCLMSVLTFVCSGPATLAFQIYKLFFLNLRKIKIILLPDLFFLGVEGGAARLGGVRYNFSLRGMFLLEA